MSRSVLCLATAVLLSVAAPPARALDTLILVRHAEKSDWPDDPALNVLQPLSDEGVATARALATHLVDTPILAVYSSRTTRTLHTGLFTARAHEVALVDEPRSADREAISAWIEELRAAHPGPGAVLVVGHSNTIPWYFGAFGADSSCHERLGVTTESYGLATEGYGHLWEIDVDARGCDAIARRVFTE